MPIKGYRTITIKESLYNLLMELKKRRELELGHEISMNELLAEILKDYKEQLDKIVDITEGEEEEEL
jgi:predicted CopG family antitoxin